MIVDVKYYVRDRFGIDEKVAYDRIANFNITILHNENENPKTLFARASRIADRFIK